MEERIEERLALKLNFYRVLEWRLRAYLAAGRRVLVVGCARVRACCAS